MKKLILLTTIVLFACELPAKEEKKEVIKEESYLVDRYACNCNQKQRLQEFLQITIKGANNMSDEEMEPVIQQLEYTAVRMICTEKPVWINSKGWIDWTKQKPEDSCTTYYNY